MKAYYNTWSIIMAKPSRGCKKLKNESHMRGTETDGDKDFVKPRQMIPLESII